MRPRWWSLGLGIFCLLIGGVWVLQGAGILLGSFMTGQVVWLWIGLGLIVVGLALGYNAVRR